MATFSELSTQLDLALTDVARRKSDYNSATTLVVQASSEYQAAVQRAQQIRSDLMELLNESLPEVDTHVRQSV